MSSPSWRIKARFYTLPEDCIEVLNLQHRDIPVGSGGQGTILPPYGKTVCMLPRMEETMGLREVAVIVKGVGSGRESSIRGFVSKGIAGHWSDAESRLGSLEV
jgi:hypothetical protein